MPIASTPEPPYTAVIFSSVRTDGDHGYARMSERMMRLAAGQPGFLGVETARGEVGLTVSYWTDEAAASAWKQVAEHLVAQERGREAWYADYRVRVATVTRDYGPVRVRAERPGDVDAVAAVTADAFAGATHSAPPVEPGGPPGEVTLLARLRDDDGWIPELSLVAEEHGTVVGHVVATRGYVDRSPALGIGPVSVASSHQRRGVGSRLVRTLLDVARERGETLACLLGDPDYYGRFDFRPAADLGVEAPDPAWGDYFQALALGPGTPRGTFRYAAPFESL